MGQQQEGATNSAIRREARDAFAKPSSRQSGARTMETATRTIKNDVITGEYMSMEAGARSFDNGTVSFENGARSFDNGAMYFENGARSFDNGTMCLEVGAKTMESGASRRRDSSQTPGKDFRNISTSGSKTTAREVARYRYRPSFH